MGATSSSSKPRSKLSDFRHNKARLGPPSTKPLYFQLPSEWLIILLSEWLLIEDVATLDMAMTNHSLRAGFLQILENIRSTSVNGRYGQESFQKLYWLSLRRVHVENIELEQFKIEQLNVLEMATLRKLILRDVDDIRVLSATINSPMLQSLDVDNSQQTHNHDISDLAIAHIHCVCSALEHFRFNTFSSTTITAGALLSILRGCKMLKTIELDCRVLMSFTASEIERLQPFGHVFTALQFPISYSSSPPPPPSGRMKAFCDLLAQSPNLKKITFENCPWSPERAHEGQDDSILVSLAQHCPSVEEIDVNGTVRSLDAGLLLLSQNCMHVRKITVYECSELTVTTFAHISRIESLQELSISNCDTVTDAGLTSLLRGCPNLRHFTIAGDGFSEQGFRGLKNAPCSQSLITIDVWFDNDSLTPALDVIIGKGLASCHNLETISIRTSFSEDASFGDAGLALMRKGCPKLKDLTLVHSETLTMAGLIRVASRCPLLGSISVDNFITNDEDDVEPFSKADIRRLKKRFPTIEFSEEIR